MHLLPSEQKERIEQAIIRFNETDKLSIFEPCDCGSRIRHNNGGNYHDEIYLRRDSGKAYVKYGTTCELVAPPEWDVCDNPETIIREYADWL
jgi:hypothetical protein